MKETMWKGKYQNTDNKKQEKEGETPKNEEISR